MLGGVNLLALDAFGPRFRPHQRRPRQRMGRRRSARAPRRARCRSSSRIAAPGTRTTPAAAAATATAAATDDRGQSSSHGRCARRSPRPCPPAGSGRRSRSRPSRRRSECGARRSCAAGMPRTGSLSPAITKHGLLQRSSVFHASRFSAAPASIGRDRHQARERLGALLIAAIGIGRVVAGEDLGCAAILREDRRVRRAARSEIRRVGDVLAPREEARARRPPRRSGARCS